MPILRPIATVADLIQELQTADPTLLVFVFDGAEAWPIEVSQMIHRTHAAPHVWIGKAADKEATLAGLIRDAAWNNHNAKCEERSGLIIDRWEAPE